MKSVNFKKSIKPTKILDLTKSTTTLESLVLVALASTYLETYSIASKIYEKP